MQDLKLPVEVEFCTFQLRWEAVLGAGPQGLHVRGVGAHARILPERALQPPQHEIHKILEMQGTGVRRLGTGRSKMLHRMARAASLAEASEVGHAGRSCPCLHTP